MPGRAVPASTSLLAVDAPAAPRRTYRAGSLAYSTGGLVRVFAALLAGEMVFTLTDVLEPKLLPVILRYHDASATQVGLIVGTITSLMQLLVMPVLGYVSDRTRTPWGRRIPYLLAATPLTSLFLLLMPYGPELSAWTGLSVMLSFALLAIAYRGIQAGSNCMFFGLITDVVPTSNMGRFLALFRVFGAAGSFVVSYWLIGGAIAHSKPIFAGIAALNLAGFGAICLCVREGVYPPNPPKTERKRRAAAEFIRESFAQPVYVWTYLVRVCLYAALALTSFVVFFPQKELGMGLDRFGKLSAWSSVGWIVLAYPLGRLMDQWGSMRVMWHGLWIITAAYLASFFLVVGDTTFCFSSCVTGLAFWVVMLAQLKLTQEIFHPLRYSQLAGAGTILQAIGVMVSAPAAGWVFEALRGWHSSLRLPWVGSVSWGPFRLVNLMLAGLYGLAWFALRQVRRHWRHRGGPSAYVPPSLSHATEAAGRRFHDSTSPLSPQSSAHAE